MTRGASDDNEWMEQGVFLRNLENLEKHMFKNSVATLYRKGGIYVVDDELISSRASDVEKKAISECKAGKEGPVADVVACSSTSVIFGMRLRVAGDREANNVKILTLVSRTNILPLLNSQASPTDQNVTMCHCIPI